MKSFLRDQTLLIVEDDTIIRQSLGETLGWFCARVEAAATGSAGWEAYCTFSPAIVILDVSLPDSSGIELARRIRQKDKKTRILFLSAHTEKEYLLEAVELGLTRYLVKPVTEEKLIGALEKCIREMDEPPAPKNDSPQEISPLGKGFAYRFEDGQLLHDGKPVKLTKSQSAILGVLLKHPEKILTYEYLQTQIWGEKYMSPAAIRSMIRDLRGKLFYDLIENVAGIGYKITPAL
jgi:DNA-binding response OmpR family regulator